MKTVNRKQGRKASPPKPLHGSREAEPSNRPVKPKAASRSSNKDGASEVALFLAALQHGRKDEIETLRALILSADKGIREHIKWNAPSFFLLDDFATMKLGPREAVQVVLHRGAKRKPGAIEINDPNGLLQWAAKDRAIVTFNDMAHLVANKRAFKDILKQWIKL